MIATAPTAQNPDQIAQAAQAAAEKAAVASLSPPPPPAPENKPLIDISNLDYNTIVHAAEQYGIPTVKALLIFLAAIIISSWASRTIRKALLRTKFDITLSKFLANAARWGILIFALLAILSVFGIQTASFAVVIGAMGLAIGLAFQGTLSNFASGIMLLVFRPFKVGDVVNAAGVFGKVDEIELFFTTIDTLDNRRLIVPNTKLFGDTIENFTYHTKRRADINVGVAYGADIDETRRALERAVQRVEKRLKDDDHMVWLDSFGDSAINWQVRVWVPTADWAPARQEVIQRIKESLDDAKITIPFPQRDVYLFRPGKGG
ncbi:mechanosensitive ion channel family protein [Pseudanabaena sp. CCNP1317]|uniref:mechanosensitive ion channel family protein n=1 Tax=Pseudanabaena sp. CCNP1317 TaxID=3110253 RepID=UPI002B1F3EF9|nr:mechanosensitive ion channel domain-containing protein [Pseudanabaena sp. CCNP1317]MEA5486629.1 mechanosensitive ion channel domain-containing protein [Pseudanabaena sp. CCNP1317]